MPYRPPVDIPWPLSTAPGARPQESAGRLINCTAEPLGDTAGAQAAWHRSPGLSTFAVLGIAGYRGSILVNNILYVAVANRLLRTNAAGTVVNIAALPGTKTVTFAKNNANPTPDIQVVDVDNGAFVVTTGSVTAFTGAGNLPAPNSVSFQDGSFFWTIGDRRVFASDLNAITVNALAFTTMQSRSSGALIRGVAYRGLMFFFTTSSCEVWNDVAAAYPAFPYGRLSVIDRGLITASALAGEAENFGNLYWVADDFGVYGLNSALQPEKISPPDLDRLIETQCKVDATQLQAGCYVEAGRSMWTLSSPLWTWEFNLNSQKWNERQSFSGGLLTRWRGAGGINAFGNWLVGDAQAANLLAIDSTSYQEVGGPMLWRLESGPAEDFPNRIRVARADFDFVTGAGMSAGANANVTDPQVMISWSDDGGVTWRNPIQKPLGQQARSRKRVSVLGLGMSGAQGRRWRLDVTDPVYVGFLRGKMSSDPRAF